VIRQLDERTLVSGQIAPADIAALAGQGVTMIVNNRPDGEDSEQPTGADIHSAAEAAGMSYRFVPVRYGIGPAEIDGMREAVAACGDGKLLAYCRSGTRSALTWALAKRMDGASADEVSAWVSEAGFDATPIAHLL